jgi:hypothetical protein
MSESLPPRLALTDARGTSALLLVQRAIDWYIEEAATAVAPPISADDARALKAAFAGVGPWHEELFDRLITFGQALFKLTELGHGPGSTVGDGLTALGSLDTTGGVAPPWRFDPAIDAAAFAKLEFREVSVGIEKAQRDHREGWWAHAQRNRAFINDAVKELPGRKLAVVLGAGAPFDLPLADLARQFERVRLIDIDVAALEATVKLVWKDPTQRAHVETRALDLTGINSALVERIDEIIAGPADGPDDLERRMSRMCRTYRLGQPPRWSEGEPRADLIVSSCVITQLAWPQRIYAERGFTQRFGPMSPALDHRWSTAWTELGLRVQQDHINALGDAATTVVLTSDVTSHHTRLDATGAERDTGKRVLALGVGELLERIPSSYQIGRHARWPWSRYRPTRKGTEGSRMDVEGVVLTEKPPPTSAAGLWLPGMS